MYQLCIDTGNPISSITLFHHQAVVSTQRNEQQKDHGSTINLHIEVVCQEAGIGLTDLQSVWVMHGPGSYTGLRIAMATAKGICYAAGIPLYGFSMFDWLSLHVHQQKALTEYGMLSQARVGEFFVEVVSPDSTRQVAPQVLSENEVLTRMTATMPWFSYQQTPIEAFPQVQLIETEPSIISTLFSSPQNSSYQLDLLHAEPLYLKNVHINKINNL
jgi:tRNA threonylcarbamoyladenosine biosynthesis protein TsaB